MTSAIVLIVLLAQVITPSPMSSPCPTKDVMRRTVNGLVPSVHYTSQSTQRPKPGEPINGTALWAYVLILVDVNPNGSVRGVKLLHSGGPAWDSRMLHDARISHYRPKFVGCKTVEGIYYYFVPIAGG